MWPNLKYSLEFFEEYCDRPQSGQFVSWPQVLLTMFQMQVRNSIAWANLLGMHVSNKSRVKYIGVFVKHFTIEGKIKFASGNYMSI